MNRQKVTVVATFNLAQCFRWTWICLVALFLSACSDSQNVTSLKKKSLIYCSEAAPESFNPQVTFDSATINATSNQLYDRLLNIDASNNTITPAIAKSWHITKDGKMITFYLRKDVEFHATDYFYPSRPLNADDILFSFNRILDPTHAFHQSSTGKYPYFERVKFADNIEKIEKIDESTIRFVLYESNASFLANLATQYAVILSAEYAEILAEEQQHKLIDTQPIGTGPFKLKEYRVGSFIRYYRHENYWQESSAIKQLVYDITTQNTGRLTKLMTGECDIIAEPVGHNKIIERKNLTLQSVISLDTSFLAFNTLEPPFNNPLVRKAVSYAINKQAIVDAVYYGGGVPAHTLLPPVSWAYSASIENTKHNITRALQLMSEAGYQDSITIDLWASPNDTSYNPNALTTALIIKENLKSIGINVNITHQHPAQIQGLDRKPPYHALIHGWSAEHHDPDNFFTPILTCAASEIGTNRAFWCHQTFDSIIEKARQTEKLEQRKYFYQQALQLLAKEMPIVPIAHSKTYIARSNNVSGNFFSTFGVRFNEVIKN